MDGFSFSNQKRQTRNNGIAGSYDYAVILKYLIELSFRTLSSFFFLYPDLRPLPLSLPRQAGYDR